MTTAQQLLTADEFLALPDPPHGGKMELVRGEVVTMAPVNMTHGELATDIGALLLAFVRPRKLGKIFVETGFRLAQDPATVLAPDVSFLEAERVPTDRRGFVAGPPTLAVEVTSPGDSDRDVADKVQEYLAFGTTRVWVVRPELRTITVHRPDGSAQTHKLGDTLSSDDAGFAVPGFELALGDLFVDDA